MKKFLCLLLSISMVVSLVACGTPSDSNAADPDTQTSDKGGSIVEVDENLLTVDLVIPATFFDEDMTTFDLDAYAKENGFNSAKLNEDGSVSINMSKSRHKEMMSELRTSISESLNEMVGAEDSPYITAIEHSESFDSVDIIVDKAGYDDAGFTAAFLPLVVYISAGMYQVFDGTEEPKCEISIIASGTNEVLASVIYPDAFEGLDEDESDIVFDDTAYTSEEITIVDNELCTMKVTGIDPNGDWGFTFNVFCENKTNKPMGFYMDYVSVNGYMCDPFWGTDIPAGKKENTSFSFSTSTLSELGVSVIEEVTFDLRVTDSEDWSADPYIDEVFSIYPTDLSVADISYAERKSVSGEVVSVDNETCTFAILSVDPDGEWGYTLNCYLENKTDSYLQFSWNDVSVNGYMCDPCWGDTVAPGKRAISQISFMNDSLKENSIEVVEEIEYTLRVSDEKDWFADPLVETVFQYKPNN